MFFEYNIEELDTDNISNLIMSIILVEVRRLFEEI